MQFNILNLFGFGYIFEVKDVSVIVNKLEGRVMIWIIGYKVIFIVVFFKVGKYYFIIYVKEDWFFEFLQCVCVF